MFYFFGFLFLIFSFLFLFFPEVLIKLSEWGNKLVITDHEAVIHRKGLGVILFCLSIFMFFISWKY